LLDDGSDILRFTRSQRVDVTHLDDVSLEPVKDGFRKRFQPVALQVVEERDAQLFLVRPLNETEIRTESLTLCGLQVIEQV
jgi:hypothetical protein